MYNNLKKALMLTICIQLLTSQAVWAADSLEKRNDNGTREEGIADIYDLSVSVTATRTERDLMDVPVSLSVVTEKQIDRAPQSSVAELLKNIPGVHVSEIVQTPGARKSVSIRGFDNNRIIILIDGVRQNFPAQVNAAGLLAIDPTQIESIEVLKGASSVLYGSDGLGGVVKITTKKGKDKVIGVGLETRYSSVDNSFTPYASVFGDINGFNYRVAASGADKGDKYLHSRETLHHSETEFEDYSARLGYKWGKGEVHFSAERFNEWSEQPFTTTNQYGYVTQIPLEDVTSESRNWYKRNTYTFGFVQRDITDNLDRLTINGSWQKLQDGYVSLDLASNQETYNSHEKNDSYSGSIQTDWTFFNSHAVSVGFDYNKDDMDIYVVQPTRIRDYRAKQETMALFIQDEWAVTENLSIIPGLRQTWTDVEFDKTAKNTGTERTGSKSYSKLVASLGAVYRGIDNLALRANYSQGFKTPAITNLYADSLRVLSNPDLEPESSDNYEVGLRYDDGTFTTDIAAFYGNYEDAITTIQVGPSMWGMINANERESYGIELYSGYRIHRYGLTPYLNATVMRSEITYDNGYKTSDIGSPQLWGKLGVKWERYFSDKFNVFTDLGVRYTDLYQQRNFDTGDISYKNQARKLLDLSVGFDGESSIGKYKFAVNMENLNNDRFKGSFELASGFLATVTAGLEF